MIRITVSYPVGQANRFDHAYYHDKHRALLTQRLSAHGLIRVEMDQCTAAGGGGPPPVVACAHLIFESLLGYQAGMKEHGKEVRADVSNYTDITPQILISEMK